MLEKLIPFRGMIVAVTVATIMGIITIYAFHLGYGKEVLAVTATMFASMLQVAAMRGKMIPPGWTIFPPGPPDATPPISGRPAPPPPMGTFRAPMPSSTGFSNAPPPKPGQELERDFAPPATGYTVPPEKRSP